AVTTLVRRPAPRSAFMSQLRAQGFPRLSAAFHAEVRRARWCWSTLGSRLSSSFKSALPLRSAANCARQLTKCGSVQHSCLLAIPAGSNPESDRRAMCVWPDVVTLVGLRAVDAHHIDCALIHWCHVRPVAVRPYRPELHGDSTRACGPVLHLKALELSSRICDKIDRRVFRHRNKTVKPLLRRSARTLATPRSPLYPSIGSQQFG